MLMCMGSKSQNSQFDGTTSASDFYSRIFGSTTCPHGGEFSLPRAAVSVAVRCEYEKEAYYLLVQRGKDPNRGRWSFPGGKLEMGETAMQGGKRELLEETTFLGQDGMRWCPETIAAHDSLSVNKDGIGDYHFLIAVCFAELKHVQALPKVTARDDAANAKWWRINDLVEEDIDVTPGLVERIARTEFLYQREVLL